MSDQLPTPIIPRLFAPAEVYANRLALHLESIIPRALRGRQLRHPPASHSPKEFDLGLPEPQEIRGCGRYRAVDRENRDLEVVARRHNEVETMLTTAQNRM